MGVVAALTGCTTQSPARPAPTASSALSASPVLSVPADPADLLVPAATALTGKNLRFSLGTPNDREEGRYDAASGLASLRRTRDGRRLETITAGPELYLLGVAPDGSVLRVDVARLPDSHGLVPLADPLAALRLITGVTEVQRTSDGYSGRIDLTRVDPGPSPATQRIVARFLGAAAERAGSVPFTARVDAQGRLEYFRATFPRPEPAQGLEYEFTVLEVGGTASVGRPAGPQVVDAPSGVYAP